MDAENHTAAKVQDVLRQQGVMIEFAPPDVVSAVGVHRRDAALLRDAVEAIDEPAVTLSFASPPSKCTSAPDDQVPASGRTSSTNNLAFAPLSVVTSRLCASEVTSRELTELMLRRIERYSSSVNAYLTVMADQALLQADRADRHRASAGETAPSLLGVPIALKDLFDTAGVRTTAGSRILSDRAPDEDATVVRLLRDAGAVILGKTHMAEFAYGFPHPDYGPSHTPWDLDRSASGSSGGSGAAVAAGLAYAALGSDTGGSIRSPAAVCGITGLKPTYGLVSRHGVVPLSWSMDHVGPMTRSAEDSRLMLDAISGYDPRDPASSRVTDRPRWPELSSLSGMRIGVFTDLMEMAQPVVRARVLDAIDTLASLRAEVIDVSLPMSETINAIAFGVMEPEAVSFHARWLREQPESYAERTRHGLLAAMTLPASQYVDAQRLRARFNEAMGRLFMERQLDLLLGPTEPTPPWLIESAAENESHQDWDLRHTVIANLTGMPALALPCGFTDERLPLSVQLFAPPFHDDLTLRVGQLYQSVTDWHLAVPPGFED